MCKDDMRSTGHFMKQLFEEAEREGAGTITLDFGGFGEAGTDHLEVGPHPGFRPTSFVMSLRSECGSGGAQFAFAEEDVAEVRQFIRALQGWVAFIEDRQA